MMISITCVLCISVDVSQVFPCPLLASLSLLAKQGQQVGIFDKTILSNLRLLSKSHLRQIPARMPKFLFHVDEWH